MDFTDPETVDDTDAQTNGEATLPTVEDVSADDLAALNMEWYQRNGAPLADTSPRVDSGSAPIAKADELDDSLKHKAEFPWLSNPSRGRRWDFDPIALRNLAQENAWVGMLVQTITKEVAETSWTITEADGQAETQKRLQTHPDDRTPIAKADADELPDATAREIHDLLMRPNPDDTWQDLVEMWLGDLLEIGSLTGIKAFPTAAYDGDTLEADADTVRPQAIKLSPPEVWTKDYHDRSGILDGFWQFDDYKSPGTGDDSGYTTAAYGVQDPTFFDTTEMVWTDMTPRSNRAYGMPPTLLVQKQLQSIDLAVTQEQQYLSRGSIPSGAWVFEEWDREQVIEWKEENAENVKGKPHKSLMFAGQGGDVHFEPMSMNFQELEFTERMRWYARIVASAFQVPTAVVGIEPEKVNYNTFQGERANFESNTLGPYLQKLERVINHELIHPHWGTDYRFEFLPGMSESTRKMISDRVRSEFNANIRTRNEARREIGLGESDEEGFKDEVVEDTDPTESDPLGDIMASKAEGAAVEFPNAGGAAFEDDATLIEFCDALAEVCDGGVFVGDNEFPGDMMGDLSGQPVRAVGTTERKAYAVWSRFRDEAVALSDPHAVNSQGETVQQNAVEKQTFDDYPEAAQENARMALEARDETGNPNDCGTRVGWERANQLDNGEALSEETIGRMAAFERHEDNKDQGEDGRADCGWMMWKAWGGDEGIAWAQDKLDEIETEQSAGDSGNASERLERARQLRRQKRQYDEAKKADALRETDEWYQFDVQPADVEALQDRIADDVSALFDDVLDDEELMDIIERLANDDETEKSLSALTRRLKDIFTENDVVARIQAALREETAAAARETVEDALADAPEAAETDVDVEAIEAQLSDREVEFADAFAQEMQDDILDTVGDGWAEGKGTREIASEISEQADINEGWHGAERIARQELHVATGNARSGVAAELDKVEVWETAGDDRVRDAHAEMQGTWKHPGDNWVVEYPDRGTQKEAVQGDSEPGIGCRCTSLLRDRDTVDRNDYAGDASP